MAPIARPRADHTMPENLRALVIWHLTYFLRRLARACIATVPSKPRIRTHHTRTAGMMMRCAGWLAHLAPFWLADIAPDIKAARAALTLLIESEQFEALLTEDPKIGRTLRPLCRMFAIKQPPCLRLPQTPRTPKPTQPKSPHPPHRRGFTLAGFHPILPHLAATPTPKKPA
ncbi:MAG: hypothetical protein B7Z78_05760 [Rhodospirillales bacterium 20-60-12]|nr:MAG: hypothetical protein B7Z78_05760 [Rhodospirillales bacterium 20-60-12]HQT66538.1 hypothetical protein [Acetobacteraceae bacterium]